MKKRQSAGAGRHWHGGFALLPCRAAPRFFIRLGHEAKPYPYPVPQDERRPPGRAAFNLVSSRYYSMILDTTPAPTVRPP
ncbi:hypothetical protein, partial [Tropicimonas marinistellae]|uniref:hypothetical protein n=1 Tax=Tropicimonas marinistellae TaxID=1739787 RepID=UPI001F3758EB